MLRKAGGRLINRFTKSVYIMFPGFMQLLFPVFLQIFCFIQNKPKVFVHSDGTLSVDSKDLRAYNVIVINRFPKSARRKGDLPEHIYY